MAALAKHMPKELREALLKVREQVEKNCEHVGDKFAEEARKIHYGESDKRGIYGETSDEEAEALADEGIEFGRLPWIPAARKLICLAGLWLLDIGYVSYRLPTRIIVGRSAAVTTTDDARHRPASPVQGGKRAALEVRLAASTVAVGVRQLSRAMHVMRISAVMISRLQGRLSQSPAHGRRILPD